MKKHKAVMQTLTQGFRGVDFTITEKIGSEVIKTAQKRVTLLDVMSLAANLKDYLRNIGGIAEYMNYYRHYADNIEEMLDEDEKHRADSDKKHRYEMGGNYAFFLGTKHDTGVGVVYANNNEAGRILKKKYAEAYPDNKVTFDTEMSHCYVYAPTREEARRFMLWMNENYFKPWVDRNIDGWDEFIKQFNKASEKEQMEFKHLMMDF